jgi:Xaa-Pro aminopeptidase
MNAWFKHRENVMRNIAGKRIEAFLVTHWADLFYLTGIELEGYWLFVTGDSIKVISPQILYRQLQALTGGMDVLCGKSCITVLAGYLKKSRIKSVGLDSCSVSLNLMEKLKKELPKISWVKIPDFVKTIRQVKFGEEIDIIRKSCKLAARIFDRIKGHIKPGRTEKHVSDRILTCFRENNVSSCFSPVVAAGINSMYPHHLSSDRIIKKDDIVTVDLGCRYEGYCSDLTRTVFLGKRKGKLKKVYETVKMAQEEVIDEIKPGVPASMLDSIARKTIKEHGYGKYFIHSTGHGVGIEVHELPGLSYACSTVLKPGMILTVEPGIYIPDVGGVRIEDTVLVTDIGCEVLT